MKRQKLIKIKYVGPIHNQCSSVIMADTYGFLEGRKMPVKPCKTIPFDYYIGKTLDIAIDFFKRNYVEILAYGECNEEYFDYWLAVDFSVDLREMTK